ncbi:hypothetical protein W97_04477, partial [Coniosporium apollinis CBS 100218]
MVAFSFLASLALIGSAVALPSSEPVSGKKRGCGEVNVVLAGLPPNHPLLIARGFPPAVVNAAIRSEAAGVIAAGYNFRVVLLGPEVDVTATLGKKLKGTDWSVAVTGNGLRSDNTVEGTRHFENILQLFRKKAPNAVLAFNRNATTTLEAVQRWAPLDSDCKDSPGKDL